VGGALGKVSDFNSISEMIIIADKELYKAKGMGRNITLINSKNRLKIKKIRSN